MAKIFQLYVTNLGNSPAITRNLCLDLKNFISSSTQPRINQRFLTHLPLRGQHRTWLNNKRTDFPFHPLNMKSSGKTLSLGTLDILKESVKDFQDGM